MPLPGSTTLFASSAEIAWYWGAAALFAAMIGRDECVLVDVVFLLPTIHSMHRVGSLLVQAWYVTSSCDVTPQPEELSNSGQNLMAGPAGTKVA